MSELDRDMEIIEQYKWASRYAPDIKRGGTRWPAAVKALVEIRELLQEKIALGYTLSLVESACWSSIAKADTCPA